MGSETSSLYILSWCPSRSSLNTLTPIHFSSSLLLIISILFNTTNFYFHHLSPIFTPFHYIMITSTIIIRTGVFGIIILVLPVMMQQFTERRERKGLDPGKIPLTASAGDAIGVIILRVKEHHEKLQ